MSHKALEEMLQSYKTASKKDFEDFFNSTSLLVYNFLSLRLKNSQDVEECCQETYFRVHKYIESYDQSKNALNWLLAIAKNVLIDKVRVLNNQLENGRGRIELDLVAFISQPRTDKSVIEELKGLIISIDNKISEADISLLITKFYWEEDYDVLAKTHNLSQVNARKKVSRLIKRLKENWQS